MPSYYFWENGNVGPVNFESGITESVNQVGHGFTLPSYGFIPVYDNSGTWTAAIGSASSTYQQAVIVEVTDVDNFVIQRQGYVNINNHGLAVGRDYYLSDDDAGEISQVPTTNLVKCVAPVNDNYLFIYNVGNPYLVNGLQMDSTTGQGKLGGALTEDTTVDGATDGYDLSLYADNIELHTTNLVDVIALLDDINLLSGQTVDIDGVNGVSIDSNSGNVNLTSNGGNVSIEASNGATGSGVAKLSTGSSTGRVDILATGAELRITEATIGATTASVNDVLTLKDATTGECEWSAPTGISSPLTTKGDLFGFSTVDDRLPVGTNDQVLTADSTQSLGIKWADISSFSGGTYGASSSYHANLTGTTDSRKDDADEIYVKGSVTATASISAGTTLFQLSETPSSTIHFPMVYLFGGSSKIVIVGSCDSSGNVSISAGLSNTDVVPFDGANFYGG